MNTSSLRSCLFFCSTDIENNVGFFAVGLLYVVLGCGGAWPIWTYTATKVVHHFVYLFAFSHEVRATFWTVTSCSFMWMSYKVLAVAL